jgi:hypothetical protein
MGSATTNRRLRHAGKIRRREEVEERLGGLGRGRLPRSPGLARGLRFPETAPAGPVIDRLAGVLPDLGPVFSAFGRYLSTRLDLLSERDCQVLSGVSDQRSPLAPAALRDLLARELSELGQSPEQAYAAFDVEPLASTVVYQEHRARLATGEPIVVRLVRPELDSELARDLELLPLLGPALAALGVSSAQLGAVIENFAEAIATASDLAIQAAAMAALGQGRSAPELAPAALKVVRALSNQRLITVEEMPGATLEDALAASSQVSGLAARGRPRAGESPESSELAVRLCHAWLRCACFSPVFPVEFRRGDVRILRNHEIAWSGGSFATLPPAAKVNLWGYLQAAAMNDPGRAGAALIRELEGGPAEGAEALRQRLRQLVPFRDGGWGAKDDLAGYLFLHWRCAAEMGYRPRPHLLPFYRGLARLAAETRQLAPARDALLEGLQAAQLAAGLGEMMRLVDRQAVTGAMSSYATALLAMPQRVGEMLAFVAGERGSLKVELVEPPAASRRKDASALRLALLLAAAAVILLAQRLTSAGILLSWTERVAPVIVGLLGTFLFRLAGRRR